MNKLTKWTDRLLPILALFTVTFFIYRDFGIRMLLGFGVLCLVLGLQFLHRVAHDRPLTPRTADAALAMLALVILANFLRPDSRHNADSLSYVIAMLVCTAFVWLHRPAGAEEGTMKLLFFGAVGIAAFSLFFTFQKDLFYTAVYPRLTSVARNYLDYFVPKGYGIGLGGYTFSDYVLFGGLAVCCGWMVSDRRLGVRAGLLAAIGVFLFVILALGRRGELLAAGVVCLVMWLIMCSRKQRIAIILGGGAFCAAALWLIIAFLPQIKEIDIFYRYVRTIENILCGYDFTSGRTQLFAWAIEGFRSAPVFGIGFDQYVTLVNPLLTDIEGSTISDAHNIYLQFLCETGIVGTVLTMIPIVYIFVTTCRCLRHAKKLEDRKPLSLCVVSFMLQAFLFFLGLYDPSFQKIVFWCFYGVCVMLLGSAMELSGWRPTGPVSRGLEHLLALLAPAGNWIWAKLHAFSKERNQ